LDKVEFQIKMAVIHLLEHTSPRVEVLVLRTLKKLMRVTEHLVVEGLDSGK
jgi:hypothetical protein